MENFIVNAGIVVVLLCIAVGIVLYLRRAKKRGQACIGCPYSKKCSGGCCDGCNDARKNNGQ